LEPTGAENRPGNGSRAQAVGPRKENTLSERKLPDPIRELYESRWQEAAEFHFRGVMLQQLFDGTAKNARLIRHTGESFFMAVRKAMRDSNRPFFARLTIRLLQKKGKRLSASSTGEDSRVWCPAWSRSLNSSWERSRRLPKPIRQRRNRALAHA